MTTEDRMTATAKQMVEAAAAELRFMYEASGQDTYRYVRLRDTIGRRLAEEIEQTEPDLAAFLRSQHPFFRPSPDDEKLRAATKALEDPDFQAVMSRTMNDMQHDH